MRRPPATAVVEPVRRMQRSASRARPRRRGRARRDRAEASWRRLRAPRRASHRERAGERPRPQPLDPLQTLRRSAEIRAAPRPRPPPPAGAPAAPFPGARARRLGEPAAAASSRPEQIASTPIAAETSSSRTSLAPVGRPRRRSRRRYSRHSARPIGLVASSMSIASSPAECHDTSARSSVTVALCDVNVVRAICVQLWP